ncbi:hypothetical protein EDD18DRAFT_342051 [Armillaria luteobubalina]|uniref:Uncharacterized protein n=1 Tax=Armillaria luteobubalina TaxID=153913 RepID=A0AA39Q1C5_9AGAR|nr:hypothetical protein EDD18DRAFT_342051 [Armillaria luteobubalina]
MLFTPHLPTLLRLVVKETLLLTSLSCSNPRCCHASSFFEGVDIHSIRPGERVRSGMTATFQAKPEGKAGLLGEVLDLLVCDVRSMFKRGAGRENGASPAAQKLVWSSALSPPRLPFTPGTVLRSPPQNILLANDTKTPCSVRSTRKKKPSPFHSFSRLASIERCVVQEEEWPEDRLLHLGRRQST